MNVELAIPADTSRSVVADLLALGYGTSTPESLAVELSRLVPHLHPVEAAGRFRRFADACTDLRTFAERLAAGSLPPEVTPADAERGMRYRSWSVSTDIAHLLAPSVVGGPSWTAPAVETAVAA